jgi:hypothetical protein
MGANFLESAAQVSSVLASLSIIFAIVAYRREIRGQNLQSLFYMHQYLAKDDFADARRICRTRATMAWSPSLPSIRALSSGASASAALRSVRVSTASLSRAARAAAGSSRSVPGSIRSSGRWCWSATAASTSRR